MSSKIKVIGELENSLGKIHQRDKVYSPEGIMCAITATMYKDPPKIIIKCNKKSPPSISS